MTYYFKSKNGNIYLWLIILWILQSILPKLQLRISKSGELGLIAGLVKCMGHINGFCLGPKLLVHDAYGLELLMHNIRGLWVDHASPNLWLKQQILDFYLYLEPSERGFTRRSSMRTLTNCWAVGNEWWWEPWCSTKCH